jgi:hypothetical protein
MVMVRVLLRILYVVELIGKGTYSVYAAQCRKRRPEFSKMLDEFGDHEYKHALLFRDAYQQNYGKRLGAEGFWIGWGKAMAYSQYLIPMGIKLWFLERIEKSALTRGNRDLASGDKNPFLEVVEKILPDEEKHAEVYAQWRAS